MYLKNMPNDEIMQMTNLNYPYINEAIEQETMYSPDKLTNTLKPINELNDIKRDIHEIKQSIKDLTELVKELMLFGSKRGGKSAKESGQLKEAALKQPKDVRVKIGNKLSQWNKINKNKNKRNSREETFELRNIKKSAVIS